MLGSAFAGVNPATDEVVARANMHQSVVRAVMELDEPYRTAVLLRYFDDLSCREIAERLEVPIETVRTRVKRGVLMLRTRLDEQHGERSAWLGPLSAMAELSTTSVGVGAATLAWMVLIMNAKFLVSMLVVVAVGLVALWSADLGAADPDDRHDEQRHEK